MSCTLLKLDKSSQDMNCHVPYDKVSKVAMVPGANTYCAELLPLIAFGKPSLSRVIPVIQYASARTCKHDVAEADVSV